jgi:hypothetical protein
MAPNLTNTCALTLALGPFWGIYGAQVPPKSHDLSAAPRPDGSLTELSRAGVFHVGPDGSLTELSRAGVLHVAKEKEGRVRVR